jgi:phage major head subunit gpT-like protein
MAIIRSAIRNLLVPGARSVFWDYEMYPAQYKEIYKTERSHMAEEKDIEIRPFGLAQFKSEAGPIAFDNGYGQRFITTYVHKDVGLSFAISKNALEDNLYKNKFGSMVNMLKQSMLVTKDILGAAPLNGAFTTYISADGKPLCATDHIIDGGTYANRPVNPSDLSEASVESALTAIRRFKDQAGKPSHTRAKKLVVAPENEWAADRLIHSAYRTGTNNNDISAIHRRNAIPEGYVVNQYLTSTSAWFILTSASDGFKHFIRRDIEIDVDTDFSTKNVLCSADESYSFGNSNPRSVYGNPGV